MTPPAFHGQEEVAGFESGRGLRRGSPSALAGRSADAAHLGSKALSGLDASRLSLRPKPLDLSKVTKITMELAGSVIAEPGR